MLTPAEAAFQEAVERIEKALRTSAVSLDLSGLGLESLPESLGQLTQLRTLNLGSNRLTSLPESLGQLTQLWELQLSGNRLSSLPESLGQLTQLQWLGVRTNQLTSVPESLGRLTQLHELSLDNNRLSSLPESLGRLTQLHELSLNSNRLSSLPESLGQLIQLQKLSLDSNRLSSLPESLGQLIQLQKLYFGGNQLTSLPESLGQLIQLQMLDLGINQLSSLPESMGQLARLQWLDLDNNRLSSLPESMGQLTRLQELYLGANQLGSLPESLGQLAQLQRLYLYGNHLTLLPEWVSQLTQLQKLSFDHNYLSSLPESLSQLTRLQELYLHGNRGLEIPPEVLGSTWDEVDDGAKAAKPEAILRYYFESRRTDSRPMSEAKLLLVGQGGVGKTSLVRYLVHNRKRDKHEKSTQGINREPWKVKVAPPKKKMKSEVTLNVWDFGGQEIMHATHQFFLTKRALYLLVLDARTSEAENNLFYWLKVIRSFGGDAPVLVVINKIDTCSPLDLNESRLKTDYPNIKGILRVSCDSGNGIAELKKAIAERVGELPHVFDPMPGPFFAVKRDIEGWANARRTFITLGEYRELCVKHTLTADNEQNRLLKFLHDLGVALNFDDPEHPYNLRDMNVLDPEWVTDAVYRVITSPKLTEDRGLLNRADLAKLLTDTKRFPPNTHEFVLELMRKFELCFDFPDSSGERFLVPERLPKDEPNVGWREEYDPAALNFRVRYNVLPPGLVCRFIVKMHTHLTFDGHDRPVSPTYWRDGAVLQVHGNRCLVRGSVEEKFIYIQVQGAEETRREALSLIRERLADIHRTIKELEAVEMVPVPGEKGIAVEYTTLLKYWRRAIDLFIPEGDTDMDVDVSELLARVDTESRLREHPQDFITVSRSAGTTTIMVEGMKTPLDSASQSRLDLSGQIVPNQVDFGIITMKEEEYRAVEKRFEPVELIPGKNRNYLFGRVQTPRGERTVLIARCLEQGHAAAQQCTNDLLADFNPHWLLLVGIAGAFPASEFTLGDVLLASRIHDFSVTAALENGVTTFAGKGGPVHREVAKLLASIPASASEKKLGDWNGPAALSMPKPAQKVPAKLTDPAFYGPDSWKRKVQKNLKAQFPAKIEPRRPLYRTESVVTGNVLAKDTALVRKWKESARQAAHVEMELGGVYEAAHHKPVLSVRGISDVVGFERSSAWTEFACQTAAAFARALVGSGLIEFS